MLKYLLLLLAMQLPLYGSKYIDLSKSGVQQDPPRNRRVLLDSKGRDLQKWAVMFHSHGTHRTPAGIAAKKHSSKSITRNGIKFTTTTELAKLKVNDAYIYFSARLYRVIDLTPEMAGQNLICRFKVRGKLYNAPTQNHFFANISFPGVKKKDKVIRPTVTPDFTNHTVSAIIPPNAKKAVLCVALYGCGELEISEAQVSVGAVDTARADVIVTSSGFTDQQFHLPEKTPFPMYFIFKRSQTQRFRNAQIEVELPEGYAIVGAAEALVLPARENKGKFLIGALGGIRRAITDNQFCPWRPQMVLLRSDRKASDTFQEMKYTMIADGKRQKTRTLKLRTCVFEKTRTPRILGSGLQFPYGHNVDQHTATLLADTMLKCGYNIWADRSSKALSNIMKSRKIPRIASPYQLRNGFHIQGSVPISGDDRFLDIYGKHVERHICPVSVYQKSAYYKSSVTQMIRDAVGPEGNLDAILTNWEPYYLDFKGCFCPKCGVEFAKFIKRPYEEIRKDWPKNILAKYRNQWIDFRSWQHGQVVRTLAASIREEGRKDGNKRAHFIPEISSYGFNDFMSERYTAQYHAKHFLDALERICVWGPYTYKAGIKTPYLYKPGQHLGYFLTSRGADRFIKKYSAKTRIHALPHGSHCGWVSTPESIVFDTLCSFIHNAAQSTPYWFYYDYRYHREMGRMNTLLAEYEKEITSWKKSSAVSITATTPVISVKHWKGAFAGTPTANMYPEIFSEKAVQIVRWTNGEKNLAAAANLWEKEGVFVKIAFPDLKKGKWIVRSEFPKTYRVCSGAELAKGIELYLPALSWSFFRVLPFDRKLMEGEQITVSSVEQLKKKLLPRIRRSFAFEEKLLSTRTDDFPDYDFGAMPEVRSANVTVSGIRLNGAQAVLVKAPHYTAVVDPEKGGRVQSLKIRGKEVVSAGIGSGLGLPGCWAPIRRIIPRKLHLCAITPEKDGVSVKMQHPADSKTIFAWEVVLKFTAKGIAQSFTVINTTQKPMRVIARFHNMLKEPSRENPVSLLMGSKKVKLPLENSVARIAPADSTVEKLFNVNNIWSGSGKIEFPKSGLKYSADKLYGVYFWNSPGAASASFEPTFQPVTLQPGKKSTVTQNWEIKF